MKIRSTITKITKALCIGATTLLACNSLLADVRPGNCNSDLSFVNISRSPGNITNGQTVTYGISVGNQSSDPVDPFKIGCDITGTTIIFVCPAADGTSTGVTNILKTNYDLPADGSGNFSTNITCVVTLNPGVSNAQARVFSPAGILHDSDSDLDTPSIFKEVSVKVFRPAICIGKQCVSVTNISPTEVVVTYRGSVTNCGDEILVNTSVVNNRPTNNTPVLTIAGQFAVGAVTNFTRSYTNVGNICGPFPDTLTVTATGAQSTAVVSNSASATCTITYPPLVVICPSNITVQCIGDVPAPNTNLVTVTGGTGNATIVFVGQTIVTNGCTNVITRTYRATDICVGSNSCQQIITVRDTIAPVFGSLPTNGTFECVAPAPPVVTATDNCTTNVVVTRVSTTNGACPTIIVHTWTARDDCGNVSVASRTNTVVDLTAPVLVGLPTNGTFQCVAPTPPVVTATDNCDTNVTVIRTSTTNGSCPTIIVHTWTATDRCTNTTSASRTNTVQDTIAPVLVGLPTSGTFQCVAPAPPVVTATDNCDTNVTVIRTSTTNGSCPTIIVHTWTATDRCTNTTSASRTNTINDTIAPVIACASNKTVDCTQSVTFDPPTATDNCTTNPAISIVTNTVVTNIQGQVIYTRTWKATDACSNISDTCSQVVTQTPCPANICVTKVIACYLGANVCGTFGETATGVFGDLQNPAFCYRISVTNCGDVALTNVTIIDNQFGNLTTNFFGFGVTNGTLAIGQGLTYEYKAELDINTTNTVTASGQSAFSGATVTTNDTAIAIVIPASIACNKIAFSVDDTDGDANNSTVVLPGDSLPHTVIWSVVVRNTGQAGLTNVTISDPGCTTNIVIPSLAAGGSVTSVLCQAVITSSCSNFVPGLLTNTVIVTATVDSGTNRYCAYDLTGTNITVRSECSATVSWPCEQGGCRQTGGGRQPGTSTYTNPALDLGGTPRYVTHGGQVGAPVGRETAFDPDSDCIHGRLTHVRHIKGGLVGNFQARSFDSLMCACLGCPENPGSGVTVNGLCNPGDRVCGPEPRRAGANKIAFSGVGNYTLTNGRRTPRSVLFRVDIEDRSEPGGSKPGGATPPADRYRIRIWVLTPTELAALNNPNNKLCGFRQAIAASETNVVIQDGAPGALGSAVFGVRAPDIDDGGELERGNHQLHPAIKPCLKPLHTCP